MSETATTSRRPRTATATAAAFNTTVHANQLALPKLDFPTFKPENYRTWSHMARIFFVQHELFDIVNGNEPNPAGTNILPKVHDGLVRLADGSILHGDPAPTWSDVQRRIWDWNRRHGLAYGFIMKSLTDNPAAYSKVIDCRTAHNVWETLTKEYGQSSNVILRVLEAQLSALFKKEDTPMAEHVDAFSQLIEQINYHLDSDEKWSNERINRTFFGTLSIDKWRSYEDGLGTSIKTMILSELYAMIKARDAAKKQSIQRESSTIMTTPVNNEANFTKHHGGGRRHGKQGKSNGYQPYDQNKRPSKEYIAKMKQEHGDNYVECRYCHWPGHTIESCHKRRRNERKPNYTPKKGWSHVNQRRPQHQNIQNRHNENYHPIFNNGGGGGNIANITEHHALSIKCTSDPYL